MTMTLTLTSSSDVLALWVLTASFNTSFNSAHIICLSTVVEPQLAVN